MTNREAARSLRRCVGARSRAASLPPSYTIPWDLTVGPNLAFFIRGPMDRLPHPLGLQFWREAPRIGLTGITQIEVEERGVITESVAYDANLATDMLGHAA